MIHPEDEVSLPGHSCPCSKAHKQSGHDGRNVSYARDQKNRLIHKMANTA